MVDLNFLGLDMVDLNFLGPAGTDLKPYMSWEIKRFLLSAMDLDFFLIFFFVFFKTKQSNFLFKYEYDDTNLVVKTVCKELLQ